ncbi:MAG: hypothetical protein ACE5FY_07675, partial [Nitrospiria bacterium]
MEALNRKERIAARNVNRLINEFVNRYEKIFGHLDQVGDPVSETYPLTRTTEQIRRDHPIVEDSIGFSDEDQQDMDFGEGMELADGLPSLPKLSSKDSPKVKTLRQIKQLKSEQKSLQKKRQSMPHGPGFSEDYGMRFVRNDPRAKRIGLRRAWPMIQKLAQKWLDLYREIQYLRRKDWPNIDAKEKNFRRQKALFRSLKNVDRMLKQRLEKYDAWDSAFDKVEEIAEGSIKPKDLQEFSEDYGMGFRFSESPDCLTCQEYQDTCQGMDFVGLQGCVRGGKILDTPKCRGRKAVQRELAKRGEGPVEKEGVEVVRTKESKTQAAPTLLEHKFQPERIEKRIPVVQKEQKVLKANLGKIGAIKQEASNDLGFWRGRHEAAKKMLEKIKSAPQVDENLLGKWERLQGGYEDELNFAKERIKISEKIQGSIEELFQFNQ